MVKLTVICLTYNHVNFIQRALDGFVMQKTDFPFEVIVHDDASTDGTAEIVRQYAEKYPDIIKPIFQTENQWSKGVSITKNFIYPQVRGKYVALCEGDDYWIDENKLQKQVDFLDANDEFSICFHPVEVIWEKNEKKPDIFPTEHFRFGLTELTLNHLLKRNFIQTNSVVYRWRFSDGEYNSLPEHIMPGDWFLHIMHAELGGIKCLSDVMSVYRRHKGGVWFGVGKDADWYLKTYRGQINFCKEIKGRFNHLIKDIFYSTIYSAYYAACVLKNESIKKELEKEFPFVKEWFVFSLSLQLKILYLKIKLWLKLGDKVQNKMHYKALKLALKWKSEH